MKAHSIYHVGHNLHYFWRRLAKVGHNNSAVFRNRRQPIRSEQKLNTAEINKLHNARLAMLCYYLLQHKV